MGWGLRRLRVEVLGVEDEGITSNGVRLACVLVPGGGARPPAVPIPKPSCAAVVPTPAPSLAPRWSSAPRALVASARQGHSTTGSAAQHSRSSSAAA